MIREKGVGVVGSVTELLIGGAIVAAFVVALEIVPELISGIVSFFDDW